MAGALGGNLAAIAKVTYSPAPHSAYAAGKVYFLDGSLSNWSTESADAFTGQSYDIKGFYSAYTGFSGSGVKTATFDLGEAREGDEVLVQGYYGTDAINRPTAVKLEWSDDSSAWTTVDDFTGLTAGGAPGGRGWLVRFDISAEGAHRYWRLSLTLVGDWLFLGSVVMT